MGCGILGGDVVVWFIICIYSVDGKVFNREKEINTKQEYGKIVFAEKVIRPMQQSINFDGFKEVFEGLKLIIEDYQKRNV